MATASSAAPVAVVDYDACWDTHNNSGEIRIKLQSGPPLVIRIENALEYIAVLTLLQGEKTVFAKQPGILTTAP